LEPPGHFKDGPLGMWNAGRDSRSTRELMRNFVSIAVLAPGKPDEKETLSQQQLDAPGRMPARFSKP
jgi:hypothetical protein